MSESLGQLYSTSLTDFGICSIWARIAQYAKEIKNKDIKCH